MAPDVLGPGRPKIRFVLVWLCQHTDVYVRVVGGSLRPAGHLICE